MKNLGSNKRLRFSSIWPLVVLTSCATTKVAPPTVIVEEPITEVTTAISLASSEIYKNKNYTFFSRIDSSIMQDVEIGSPQSMRRAVQNLRKKEGEIGKTETVLLGLENEIMNIVWPNEKFDIFVQNVPEDNSYIGAINSAKNGIYDTSTGKVDFLTLVLPSLVILKVDNVDSFREIAEEDLKAALKLRSSSVLANYLLGTLYYKVGDYNNALRYYSVSLKNAPESYQVNYVYSKTLYDINDVSSSYKIALSLLERFPSSVELLKLCANCSFTLKDYDKSEEYIVKVLQQEPNDLSSLLFRARILIEKKDYIHAASLLDTYARQDSSSREYLLLRAQIQYGWSKNINAAIQTIEQALSLYEDDIEVLLFASKLCNASGDLINNQSAEYYSKRILEKDPDNMVALNYAVDSYVTSESWQQAYEASSKYIENQKLNEEAIYRHVMICIETGRKDEAWNIISPIYKNKSNNEEIIKAYIIALQATDRNIMADNLIKELLPNVSSKLKSFLYYRRAIKQDDENVRLSDLRSSLISNPRNISSLFELYRIYLDKKDYRKSYYYLKQVVALNPNDARAKEAAKELEKLLK